MAKSWIIANWKMNSSRVESIESIMTITQKLPSEKSLHSLDFRVVVCPPTPFLSMIATLVEDSMLLLGAQDCHSLPCGSYTGGVSAEMLRDVGASLVIIGHSEMRAAGDDNNAIKAKASAVVRAKMLPVICVGDDVQSRAIGRDKEMIIYQLSYAVPPEAKNIIIAYEPIWAIGTGKAADEGEISLIFDTITEYMQRAFPAIKFALCYGGSVNSKNAADILKIRGCNGLLVGNASLETYEFLKIIATAQEPI